MRGRGRFDPDRSARGPRAGALRAADPAGGKPAGALPGIAGPGDRGIGLPGGSWYKGRVLIY